MGLNKHKIILRVVAKIYCFAKFLVIVHQYVQKTSAIEIFILILSKRMMSVYIYTIYMSVKNVTLNKVPSSIHIFKLK